MDGLEASKELRKETRKGGQYYIVKSEKRRLLDIVEEDLKVADVFANIEMDLDASKTIDGRTAYFLIIKNEWDEELEVYLGGGEKDYNVLKEWLKRR